VGNSEQLAFGNAMLFARFKHSPQLGHKGMRVVQLLWQRAIQRGCTFHSELRGVSLGIRSHQIHTAAIDPPVVAILHAFGNRPFWDWQSSYQVPAGKTEYARLH